MKNQKITSFNAKVDENGLILEAKLMRELGITRDYLDIIKRELNITPTLIPRIVKGEHKFNYRKLSIKQSTQIAEYLEGKKGA